MMRRSFHGKRSQSVGQSLVEFALVLPLFLLMLMVIFDGGRAIFAFNQMSQISRSVARTASVTCFQTNPRCDSTTAGKPVTTAIAASQAGLQAPVTWTIQCVDATSYAVHNLNSNAGAPLCKVGDLVRVNVSQQFNLIYGLLQAWFGPVSVGSTSEQQILQ